MKKALLLGLILLGLTGFLSWPMAVRAADPVTEPLALSPEASKQLPRLDQAAAPVAKGFTIFMIGDSTMANKPLIPENPERGWGQMFGVYFKAGVRVENHALNGRSSKSFRDEGHWAVVQQRLKPGDWVIIQFGHNDEKNQDATRYTTPNGTFKENLARYVAETRAAGANPILATPVARRKFDDQGQPVNTHGDYVQAVRDVAVEQKVPLIDLNKQSEDLLRRMGPELSKKLHIYVTAAEYPALPKGRQDDTHFCAFGASRMCDLAVVEIQAHVPELKPFLNAGK